MKTMKYLLSLLLFATQAQAKPYPLKLIIVHRNEISDQTQLDWFRESLSLLPETPYRLISVKVVPDVVHKNRLDQYWSRLFDWAKHFRNPKIQTHYLLPPVWQNGIDYGGGIAGAICTTTHNLTRKFSYSIMRLANYQGLDRHEHSIRSTEHELLHTLGANHIESVPNIMRSYYTPGPQPILPLTLQQLEYCKENLTPTGRPYK